MESHVAPARRRLPGWPPVRRAASAEEAWPGRARVALVAASSRSCRRWSPTWTTMPGPSNSSLGIRTVEWLREHGAAGLVARVESVYYSLTSARQGRPGASCAAAAGFAATVPAGHAAGAGGSPTGAEYRPPRVRPLRVPRCPARASGTPRRRVKADPPLLLTTLRDPAEYPRLVAGVAWINTSRTLLDLNPGRQEPSVPIPRGSMDVPLASRPKLLATLQQRLQARRRQRRIRPARAHLRDACTTDRARSSDTPTGAST